MAFFGSDWNDDFDDDSPIGISSSMKEDIGDDYYCTEKNTMSNEKFTPEWDDTYFPLISDSVGNHIATIAACENEVMRKRGNLIKAAPDMLEMLDEVGSDLAVAFASTPGIESKIWQDILKEDIQKICAVLKKARGEE